MSATGREMFFKAGTTIFEQGTVSEGVYLILEGAVDIVLIDGGETFQIATLSSGQLIGETSVFDGSDHTASAIAVEPTKTLFIPADNFRESFSDPLVRHVVTTLSRRLRSTLQSAPSGPAAKEGTPDTVSNSNAVQLAGGTDIYERACPIIEGDSRFVLSRLLVPVEMKSMPFTVGRSTDIGSKVVDASDKALLIPVGDRHWFKETHFEVSRNEDRYIVQDVSDGIGTIVNGTRIGYRAMKRHCALSQGENKIIAGGEDSPVRFVIHVPRPCE